MHEWLRFVIVASFGNKRYWILYHLVFSQYLSIRKYFCYESLTLPVVGFDRSGVSFVLCSRTSNKYARARRRQKMTYSRHNSFIIHQWGKHYPAVQTETDRVKEHHFTRTMEITVNNTYFKLRIHHDHFVFY